MSRFLSRPVPVEAMIEFLMWLSVPYIVIGLVFTIAHPDDMRALETQLQTRIPAGADLASFGAITVLWPMMLITGPLEERCHVG
ncbi:hypothetical protein [Mycolicibacterium diernhoferi]|uniref:Uncharacterized protein n=1 Tax=Mycolicibacterium diernhoferi TaxID=1801 RepID=A0A1Q4H4D7_9MYCO|nr:hypothetical protein [Mycolicibacterium diernhoferi]OJZ62424.1 hypothetical protein BRW64_26860 [Mycolicibacterium diernhoferi]OPE54956.1 hypothetical protein BV510_07555 [Mycolicibacterium diernhoferi]PEG52139.1 hypothetical protein CRI78_23065 [Mycolicibacterium diernhoferi]QYL22730.1 hypothetical protein K0O62_28135 [Mycolicibacterium diernhoferi]